ncbi:MAG: bifunctional DNA-formamidopyrimidine glycosylase/DNA-(apurinic or apyrimidinic site) lyase [Paracoccaceae bacterium]
MPELPEVETVRRGLEPVIAGRVIESAEVRRPDLRRPLPERMAERLRGRRVRQVRRRSKYILADLSGGETLIIHLGMTGRILVSTTNDRTAPGEFHHPQPAPEKHDHVILHMEDGSRVTFNDARRFGMMDLCPTETLDAHVLLAGLGPEPLGNAFNADYLHDRLSGRRTPVKSALLDQTVVAGLGNIYANEALWRAAISPRRQACNIGWKRCERLVPAIRDVLSEAIAAGGSSLRDHRRTNGELGYFQHSFAVYGREGQPCSRPGCDGRIARIAQTGRSSFYCPACQR